MLEQRASGPELMDGPGFGHEQVVDTFRLLVPVNRLFGGIQPALNFFQRESQTWDRHRTYRILDAGCGVGDVATSLARWARRSGYRLQIDGMDRHAQIIELGRQRCRAYPEIVLSQQDVLQLDNVAYDYVHASQFIHHFPDEEIVPLLGHLLAMSQRKVVINDLVRAPLHYLGTWLLTLFTPSVFRHDARLSIRRGFKIDELHTLLTDGGLRNFSLERHFFYRLVLILAQESSPS
jgi:2-polyprenyl-3-methyl-5-hydroxy-6-metoxy-1,4-benzoquinol methylase